MRPLMKFSVAGLVTLTAAGLIAQGCSSTQLTGSAATKKATNTSGDVTQNNVNGAPGDQKNLPPASPGVTYTSADPSIAKVNPDGTITLGKVGTTTVLGKDPNGNVVSTTTVNVSTSNSSNNNPTNGSNQDSDGKTGTGTAGNSGGPGSSTVDSGANTAGVLGTVATGSGTSGSLSTDSGASTLTAPCQNTSSSGTSWQMIRGTQIPFAQEIDVHGDPSEYTGVVIPAENDATWQPRTEATIEFDEASQLPDGSCHTVGDFTFFQTSLDIPTTITSLILQVGSVDDGVRATIFNSKNPAGLVPPGAYIQLGGQPITVDFTQYAAPGHNRIVMTHIDDCVVRRFLHGVQFLVGSIPVQTCPAGSP